MSQSQSSTPKVQKLIQASRNNWAREYKKPDAATKSNGQEKRVEEADNSVVTQGGVPNMPEYQ